MPSSVVSQTPTQRTAKTTASRAKKTYSTSSSSKERSGAVNGVQHHPSPYEIMASRLANRVAEMAENYTIVERERPSPQPPQPAQPQKKPPRKLDIRLPPTHQSPTNITFSAPFLDNTLKKLLDLQNRMLRVSNDIAACDDVDESVKQEQFAQSAELSRIIALICAEKARQS
ncbi:hypothetical protein GQ43DRAFT_477703 [Delitschia confertaspora ATCC 74209]|uniref:Uncharacterized protein n=1 Tax=Delitschia confertaspora ATCC 74209 TaxID=1513339 RepID=A0A9P4MZ86_9PLEO|nr:hypothetical protein GQ43DRAFT_477703 [Delitschia confertaspora ATCC 74209]